MRLTALAFAVLLSLPSRSAFAVEVTASIAPVHSLVARVMQGVETPYLLLRPGASPHDNALRPSDAAALQRAALVFWVGPQLEPWLKHPLAALAVRAQVVSLADTPGLIHLPARDGAVFETHDHGEENHSSDNADPHLWLDPENATLWLDAIATSLAETDPGNRALYLANAEQAKAELAALTTEIDARLDPFKGRLFIVYHDAFHYFENRFGIEASGAVAMSDARAPGPARVTRIAAHIRGLRPAQGSICLFLEPQLRSPLADTLAEETGVKIGLLDPLGYDLEPGAELYPRLLRGMADSFTDCLD